jgi:hypothetical protein
MCVLGLSGLVGASLFASDPKGLQKRGGRGGWEEVGEEEEDVLVVVVVAGGSLSFMVVRIGCVVNPQFLKPDTSVSTIRSQEKKPAL